MKSQDFTRVAIVNRGEAAMRFIHAAREYNLEKGTSLKTIALFTDPDRHAMFVREADEAVYLGPASVLDQSLQRAKSSYVDYSRLAHALIDSRAEAVWTGWDFVAEHAAFAELCGEMNLVVIGPDASEMERVNDRISAKRLAENCGLSVTPWSGGPVETLEAATRRAEHLGFPLLIKPAAGRGGAGFQLVRSMDELAERLERARAEASKAFGDPTVFLEKHFDNGQHVKVDVFSDNFGTTWALGVRGCTFQQHWHAIVEECPCPHLSPAEDQALRDAAVRFIATAGYRNAGTVEFFFDLKARTFSFADMNASLAPEHPLVECTTGFDLVKLQIDLARGSRLTGDQPRTSGHAIQVQLRAEDPDKGFKPSTGTLERFRIATGPGIRVDRGITEGDPIPPEFDPLISKVIAFGRNRHESMARLQRALRESVVIVKRGATNKSSLVQLLSDEGLRGTAARDADSHGHADVALVHAAIEAYEAQLAVERGEFYAAAVRGRPQVTREVGRATELWNRGQAYSPQTFRIGPHQYRVDIDGLRIHAELERLGHFESWLRVFGQRFHVISVAQGLSYQIEVDGTSHKIDRDDTGVVRALAPSVVVSVGVKAGDMVSEGDRIAVLEAMKMEMNVTAPFSGRVRQVLAIPNVQVDAGAALLQIDPDVRKENQAASERIAFGRSKSADPQKSPAETWQPNLEILRQFMLGFDVDPKLASQVSLWLKSCDLNEDDFRHAEDEILNIFADICSLFERDPDMSEFMEGEEPSTESYLFSYLRRLETEGDSLPEHFVTALKRALAHYDVSSLNRSPELEDALFWIYKSHQRVEQQTAPITAILERRLQSAHGSTQPANESLRILLDRTVAMSNGRFPVISDLARELRYRCFDRRLFEDARKIAYERVEEQLAYMAAHPEASDRQDRLRCLVECPQPLVGRLSSRFSSSDPSLAEFMLEAITRRYYRIRSLDNFRTLHHEGHCFASVEYDYEGKRIHVFATHAQYPELLSSLRSMNRLIADVAAEHEIVIDVYAWRSNQANDQEASQDLQNTLNAVGFTRSIRRIVVEIASPPCAQATESMQHFTYRLTDGQWSEEKLYRNIHPMMAKRLHLWRMSNFDLERLPSADDIYLLHAVARENPKDERLIACAEVRDITPIRNSEGRVVQLPHLERMLTEAMASIRLAQSRRPANRRLYWNRIFLYVWQPFNLQRDELRDIVQRLKPAAEGLGLEQVVVRAHIPSPMTGEVRDMVVRISNPGDSGTLITFRPAEKLQPIRPLPEYDQKVLRMRQRGMIYPYEIIKMLTPAVEDTRADFPAGEFQEFDLNSENQLEPVERPYGQNKANIITGVIRNFTEKYPEGMARVMVLGDPSKDLGALAEPECRRIIAAIELAQEKRLPLEWFALSAGAKISMASGVENMDWIARVLRSLIDFTQAGGEVNLIINGINVGAQPYWNAEATMLMHTRGILIMTPKAAMVLTGKRALDYSGGISAEDNLGIGGYDRIMGINGQAQYWARDLDDACHILFRHYEHTYLAAGERFPRRAATGDPIDRDVRGFPHPSTDEGFASVGDVLSEVTNPGHKKSFDVRTVMRAAIDQDHAPLERWAGMRAAETAVIWDAHVGGYPVCLIGIESKPVPRIGFVPADGPDQWCAGTLFPQSSKKIARAINAASNNRPVVMLANLSGFDGSPESMRRLQLEYGAEIGRSVVNFKGPIVFCVISRYHGGAYVVFSRALNEQLEVVALEGTFASVIGGAPAAAVVFAGEVEARAKKDPRLQELSKALATAEGAAKGKLRAEWDALFKIVHSEKLGEVASEFDRVHSVQRALEVGALHRIIPPETLRPYLVDAIRRGIESTEQQAGLEKDEILVPDAA
jgi:acetyl/propionyl-CoA carboxylase alpha subunit/acetyl-CoA carboxylase carboxyltransferase component